MSAVVTIRLIVHEDIQIVRLVEGLGCGAWGATLAFKINRSQPEMDPFMSPTSWEFNYVCNFPKQSMTLNVEAFSLRARTKNLSIYYGTNN